MAVTLVDLDFKLPDLIGSNFNPRRTHVWIETNIESGAVIDTEGNEIHLGNARPDAQSDGDVTAAGVGKFTGLIATNSDTNPTDFQYRVQVRYDKHHPAESGQPRGKSSWSSGWFSLTATSDLADVAAEAYVPPTFQSQAQAYLDAQAAIAGIDDTDSAVAALIEDELVGPLTTAALSASYVAPDVILPAPTGTAATDTAAWNAALAACPAGGRIFVPKSATSTPYALNAALVITKHVTIEGNSLTQNFRPVDTGGGIGSPSASAPFKGTILRQDTAGTNIFELGESNVSLNLKNLGLTWGDAIKNSDTGHGIYAASPDVPSEGGHDAGIAASRWENIAVYGHDGDHYAAYLLNPILSKIYDLNSYGGGILYVECDSYLGNYGNMEIYGLYGEVNQAGTANGVDLRGRTRFASTGVLNLMTFERPQVNLVGAAATAGTQYAWRTRGGTAVPDGISLKDPDIEITTGSSSPIDFGGPNGGTVVSGNPLLTKAPVDGMHYAGGGYQAWTTAGTFTDAFRVPDGIYQIHYRVIGGGGGGGGGGSASAVTNQGGGGGGGAPVCVVGTMAVTPRSAYTVIVGAGGTGGAGGASGGNAGTAGGLGGTSQIGGNVKAAGGGGGNGGTANSNASANGGQYGRTGSINTSAQPGFGGNGQVPNGLGAYPLPPGVIGGAGGGGATATNGGGRGTVGNLAFPFGSVTSGGTSGASATAAGQDALAPTGAGQGGGGGGGGAPGGKGGDGSAGHDGLVEIWW